MPSTPVTEAVTTEEFVDDEICRVAHVMARLWASDDEIAAALDISLATFNDLRDRHLEFAEAIASGRERTYTALERALTRRAFGHSYSADGIFSTREGDIVRQSTLKDVWPDPKAEDIYG
jgi:hypothetical protein